VKFLPTLLTVGTVQCLCPVLSVGCCVAWFWLQALRRTVLTKARAPLRLGYTY
jgi:hypothetical protein